MNVRIMMFIRIYVYVTYIIIYNECILRNVYTHIPLLYIITNGCFYINVYTYICILYIYYHICNGCMIMNVYIFMCVNMYTVCMCELLHCYFMARLMRSK